MAKVQNANLSTETINGNLVVVREPVKDKNGNQLIRRDGGLYYNYVVRGIVRGEKRTIRLAPRDQGGYEPLDIIFSISDKAELDISEVKQEINGIKSTRTVYTVQVADEDGELWKCEVKPDRDSAKALLNFLLISLRKEKKTDNITPDTAV